MSGKVRLGIYGTRGIPSSYSGFETFAEKLSLKLRDEFDITVFTRVTHTKYPFRSFKGIRTVLLPSIPQKHLDTITHTFFSLLWSLARWKPDIALICGVGNATLLPIFKAFGIKTVINVDGHDWKREKWEGFASAYLKMCERIAPIADVVVADAIEIKRYYERFAKNVVYIPYGGIEGKVPKPSKKFLRRFSLDPKRYVLFVGRLVPENSPDVLVRAFLRAKREGKVPADRKLAVVGDAPYVSDYKNYLLSLARGRDDVVFTGYVFGEGYLRISVGAEVFVLCARVGGTHPVLVEQMSLGNPVIAYLTESNKEVLGDTGIFFRDEDELVEKLGEFYGMTEEQRRELSRRTKLRADTFYSWQKVAEDYKCVFLSLI